MFVLLFVVYKVHNSSAQVHTKQKVLVSPLAGARLVLRVQSYEKNLKQAQNRYFLCKILSEKVFFLRLDNLIAELCFEFSNSLTAFPFVFFR